MSIFSSAFKAITKTVGKTTGLSSLAGALGIKTSLFGTKTNAMRALPQVGGAAIKSVGAGLTTIKGSLPGLLGGAGAAIASGSRALVARAGGLPTIAREAAIGAGLTIAGGILFDQSGQPVGRLRSRRMNPLNARAARRAIRRVKSVHKMLQAIEKSLPRKR